MPPPEPLPKYDLSKEDGPIDDNFGTTIGKTPAKYFHQGFDKDDFLWWSGKEPHICRRKEMLAKYGDQIKPLMKYDPWSIVQCAGVSFLLISIAVISRNFSWPWFLLTAYVSGTVLTHNMFLSIHEITHNLAAPEIWQNNLLAMVANGPIVIPYCMAFKVYHAEHHRYLGWNGVDTDLPSAFEAKLLSSFAGKAFFLTFQILFYALRPMLVRPKKLLFWNVVNFAFNFSLDAIIVSLWGWTPLFFLIFCVFCAGTIGPLSGHFLSEHFVFDPRGKQDTYSYYGWANYVNWNVGYHNEHHDFPNIPGSKLYRLREIAPEYYDNLVQSDEYWKCTWRFLTDDRVQLWTRVKRERNAAQYEKMLLEYDREFGKEKRMTRGGVKEVDE